MTRKERREAILAAVAGGKLSTQEDLISALAARGISTTQSTLSRDIRDLGIVKRSGNGGMYYVASQARDENAGRRHDLIIAQSVIAIVPAGNICCVKCHSGAGAAVGAAIDSMPLDGMVGSIAGDDTIFVLCTDEEHAISVGRELERKRA